MRSIAQSYIDEGVEKGLEKGLVKSIKQGIATNSLAIAKKMLKDGIAVDRIAKFTKLSPIKINQLKKIKFSYDPKNGWKGG